MLLFQNQTIFSHWPHVPLACLSVDHMENLCTIMNIFLVFITIIISATHIHSFFVLHHHSLDFQWIEHKMRNPRMEISENTSIHRNRLLIKRIDISQAFFYRHPDLPKLTDFLFIFVFQVQHYLSFDQLGAVNERATIFCAQLAAELLDFTDRHFREIFWFHDLA